MLDPPIRNLVFLLFSFTILTAIQGIRLKSTGYEFAADVDTVVEIVYENFTCNGKAYGYYADQELDCKVFHICSPVESFFGRPMRTYYMFSFFCPDKTIFSQDSRTCIAEEYALPCERAHTLYNLNKSLGRVPSHNHRKHLLANSFGSDLHINNVIPGGSGVSGNPRASFEKRKFSSHSLKPSEDPQISLQSSIDGETPESRKSLEKVDLQNGKLGDVFSNQISFNNNEQTDGFRTELKSRRKGDSFKGQTRRENSGFSNTRRNSNLNTNQQIHISAGVRSHIFNMEVNTQTPLAQNKEAIFNQNKKEENTESPSHSQTDGDIIDHNNKDSLASRKTTDSLNFRTSLGSRNIQEELPEIKVIFNDEFNRERENFGAHVDNSFNKNHKQNKNINESNFEVIHGENTRTNTQDTANETTFTTDNYDNSFGIESHQTNLKNLNDASKRSGFSRSRNRYNVRTRTHVKKKIILDDTETSFRAENAGIVFEEENLGSIDSLKTKEILLTDTNVFGDEKFLKHHTSHNSGVDTHSQGIISETNDNTHRFANTDSGSVNTRQTQLENNFKSTFSKNIGPAEILMPPPVIHPNDLNVGFESESYLTRRAEPISQTPHSLAQGNLSGTDSFSTFNENGVSAHEKPNNIAHHLQRTIYSENQDYAGHPLGPFHATQNIHKNTVNIVPQNNVHTKFAANNKQSNNGNINHNEKDEVQNIHSIENDFRNDISSFASIDREDNTETLSHNEENFSHDINFNKTNLTIEPTPQSIPVSKQKTRSRTRNQRGFSSRQRSNQVSKNERVFAANDASGRRKTTDTNQKANSTSKRRNTSTSRRRNSTSRKSNSETAIERLNDISEPVLSSSKFQDDLQIKKSLKNANVNEDPKTEGVVNVTTKRQIHVFRQNTDALKSDITISNETIEHLRSANIVPRGRKRPFLTTPATTTTTTRAPVTRTFTTTTLRPVSKDRGSKKFEFSAYLLQTGAFGLRLNPLIKNNVKSVHRTKEENSQSIINNFQNKESNKPDTGSHTVSPNIDSKNISTNTRIPTRTSKQRSGRKIRNFENNLSTQKSRDNTLITKGSRIDNSNLQSHDKLHTDKVKLQVTDNIQPSNLRATNIKGNKTSDVNHSLKKKTQTILDGKKRDNTSTQPSVVNTGSLNKSGNYTKPIINSIAQENSTTRVTNSFHQLNKETNAQAISLIDKKSEQTLSGRQIKSRVRGSNNKQTADINISVQTFRVEDNSAALKMKTIAKDSSDFENTDEAVNLTGAKDKQKSNRRVKIRVNGSGDKKKFDNIDTSDKITTNEAYNPTADAKTTDDINKNTSESNDLLELRNRQRVLSKRNKVSTQPINKQQSAIGDDSVEDLSNVSKVDFKVISKTEKYSQNLTTYKTTNQIVTKIKERISNRKARVNTRRKNKQHSDDISSSVQNFTNEIVSTISENSTKTIDETGRDFQHPNTENIKTTNLAVVRNRKKISSNERINGKFSTEADSSFQNIRSEKRSINFGKTNITVDKTSKASEVSNTGNISGIRDTRANSENQQTTNKRRRLSSRGRKIASSSSAPSKTVNQNNSRKTFNQRNRNEVTDVVQENAGLKVTNENTNISSISGLTDISKNGENQHTSNKRGRLNIRGRRPFKTSSAPSTSANPNKSRGTSVRANRGEVTNDVHENAGLQLTNETAKTGVASGVTDISENNNHQQISNKRRGLSIRGRKPYRPSSVPSTLSYPNNSRGTSVQTNRGEVTNDVHENAGLKTTTETENIGDTLEVTDINEKNENQHASNKRRRLSTRGRKPYRHSSAPSATAFQSNNRRTSVRTNRDEGTNVVHENTELQLTSETAKTGDASRVTDISENNAQQQASNKRRGLSIRGRKLFRPSSTPSGTAVQNNSRRTSVRMNRNEVTNDGLHLTNETRNTGDTSGATEINGNTENEQTSNKRRLSLNARGRKSFRPSSPLSKTVGQNNNRMASIRRKNRNKVVNVIHKNSELQLKDDNILKNRHLQKTTSVNTLNPSVRINNSVSNSKVSDKLPHDISRVKQRTEEDRATGISKIISDGNNSMSNKRSHQKASSRQRPQNEDSFRTDTKTEIPALLTERDKPVTAVSKDDNNKIQIKVPTNFPNSEEGILYQNLNASELAEADTLKEEALKRGSNEDNNENKSSLRTGIQRKVSRRRIVKTRKTTEPGNKEETLENQTLTNQNVTNRSGIKVRTLIKASNGNNSDPIIPTNKSYTVKNTSPANNISENELKSDSAISFQKSNFDSTDTVKDDSFKAIDVTSATFEPLKSDLLQNRTISKDLENDGYSGQRSNVSGVNIRNVRRESKTHDAAGNETPVVRRRGKNGRVSQVVKNDKKKVNAAVTNETQAQSVQSKNAFEKTVNDTQAQSKKGISTDKSKIGQERRNIYSERTRSTSNKTSISKNEKENTVHKIGEKQDVRRTIKTIDRNRKGGNSNKETKDEGFVEKEIKKSNVLNNLTNSTVNESDNNKLVIKTARKPSRPIKPRRQRGRNVLRRTNTEVSNTEKEKEQQTILPEISETKDFPTLAPVRISSRRRSNSRGGRRFLPSVGKNENKIDTDTSTTSALNISENKKNDDFMTTPANSLGGSHQQRLSSRRLTTLQQRRGRIRNLGHLKSKNDTESEDLHNIKSHNEDNTRNLKDESTLSVSQALNKTEKTPVSEAVLVSNHQRGRLRGRRINSSLRQVSSPSTPSSLQVTTLDDSTITENTQTSVDKVNEERGKNEKETLKNRRKKLSSARRINLRRKSTSKTTESEVSGRNNVIKISKNFTNTTDTNGTQISSLTSKETLSSLRTSNRLGGNKIKVTSRRRNSRGRLVNNDFASQKIDNLDKTSEEETKPINSKTETKTTNKGIVTTNRSRSSVRHRSRSHVKRINISTASAISDSTNAKSLNSVEVETKEKLILATGKGKTEREKAEISSRRLASIDSVLKSISKKNSSVSLKDNNSQEASKIGKLNLPLDKPKKTEDYFENRTDKNTYAEHEKIIAPKPITRGVSVRPKVKLSDPHILPDETAKAGNKSDFIFNSIIGPPSTTTEQSILNKSSSLPSLKVGAPKLFDFFTASTNQFEETTLSPLTDNDVSTGTEVEGAEQSSNQRTSGRAVDFDSHLPFNFLPVPKADKKPSGYWPEAVTSESSSSGHLPILDTTGSFSSRYLPEPDRVGWSSSDYLPGLVTTESSSSLYLPVPVTTGGFSSGYLPILDTDGRSPSGYLPEPVIAGRSSSGYLPKQDATGSFSSGYLPKPVTTAVATLNYLPLPLPFPLNAESKYEENINTPSEESKSNEFDDNDDDIVSRIFALPRRRQPEKTKHFESVSPLVEPKLKISTNDQEAEVFPESKLRLIGTSVKSTVSISKGEEAFPTLEFPLLKTRSSSFRNQFPLTDLELNALKTLTYVNQPLRTHDRETNFFRSNPNSKAR